MSLIKVRGKGELTMSSRKSIFCMLYDRSKDGRVSDVQKVRVATAFDTSQTTVKRIFRTAISNMEAHLQANETVENMEKLHKLSTHSLPLSSNSTLLLSFKDIIWKLNKRK